MASGGSRWVRSQCPGHSSSNTITIRSLQFALPAKFHSNAVNYSWACTSANGQQTMCVLSRNCPDLLDSLHSPGHSSRTGTSSQFGTSPCCLECAVSRSQRPPVGILHHTKDCFMSHLVQSICRVHVKVTTPVMGLEIGTNSWNALCCRQE